VAGLFHAQVLNTAALSRDAGVARMTVEGFLGILEDTLLAFRLPAYEGRLRVREKKHPKLYWVDPGLARAAKRHSGAIAPEERGALLEGWVAATLRAWGDVYGLFDEMYYWAPAEASQTEVDFLLRKGDRFVAMEIKSSGRLSADDFRGLRAVTGLKGLARRILVAPVTGNRTTEDGIDVWPLEALRSPEALRAAVT
jgi:predicted AAA+ superfamily ATPase